MIEHIPDKVQFVTWEDILGKINELVDHANEQQQPAPPAEEPLFPEVRGAPCCGPLGCTRD